MTGESTDRETRLAWGILAAGFVASRIGAAVVFGLAFDDGPLVWFWQYVDPVLLERDALRSVYYHHAQPPLFNLYLAGVVKTCGGAAPECFAASYHGFGLALHAALFALLLRIGVGRWIALATTLFFAFTPASLLYEHWLFYTYPVATLLVVAAVFVHRSIAGGGRRRDLLVLSAALVAVALTRSLFHLAWLAGGLALVAWPLRARWRRVVACAALPVVLAVGVYAKNAALFGSFSSSSWLGMSVARLAIEPIPLGERRALVESGRIGRVSLVEPFSPIEAYPPGLRRGARTDHPVLSAAYRSTGAVNFNHGAYPAIARAYLRDARALIAERPDVYRSSVGRAWWQFAMPPSIVLFLQTNRTRMGLYAGLWSAGLYGFTLAPLPTDRPATREDLHYRMHTWALVFLLLASFAVAMGALRGAREWLGRGRDPALGATLLFAAGTIVYVAVVGNALEIGENNRFRFLVEPLLFALIGWLLAGLRHGGHEPAAGGRTGPGDPRPTSPDALSSARPSTGHEQGGTTP